MSAVFNLGNVPREPNEAVIYLLEYIFKNKPFIRENVDNFQKNQIIFALKFAIKNSKILNKQKNSIKDLNISFFYEYRSPYDELLRTMHTYLSNRIIDDQIKSHFDVTAGSGVTFKINEDDKVVILTKISEMREIVNASNIIDQGHKRRLLSRLSELEKEIYKMKGSFDIILGGIVDFGDALGRFGRTIKPLTDRMCEIRSVVQKKTKDYEMLPPPDEPKMLPPPNREDSEQMD